MTGRIDSGSDLAGLTGERLPEAAEPTAPSPWQRFLVVAGPGAAPGRPGSTLLRHLLVALVVGLLLFLLSYDLDDFSNYQLANVAGLLCATAGLTVLIGLNGQIALGHGAVMAVGAYTVALMQNAFRDAGVDAGWTVVASLLGALVAATLVGVGIGVVAARLRGPYLAGITLGLATIVPAITAKFASVFKGDQGLSFPIPPPPQSMPDLPPAQWQAWIATLCALVVMLLLANVVRSRFGRAFRAVRDDEIAARLSGIHIARTQVLAFVVSAASAGLGGGVLAVVIQNVSPGGFALTLSLYLFLAVIIGGLGSLLGALWGALILVLLPDRINQIASSFNSSPELTRRLNGNLALAIFGLTLIVVIIAAPGGVQGLLNRVGRLVGRFLHNREGTGG
jgi:branched-chain amino acid transport system permease protein